MVLLLPLLWVLPAKNGYPAGETDPIGQVTVHREASMNNYRIRQGNCILTFTVFPEGSVNRSVLQLTAAHEFLTVKPCPQPLTGKLVSIKSLLDALVEGEGDLRHIRTLSWGKEASPDVLAEVIHTRITDPKWAVIPKNKGAALNRVNRDLIAAVDPYRALKTLFSGYGMILEEGNVKVLRQSQLATLPTPLKQRITKLDAEFQSRPPQTRVPTDLMLWFNVSHP